MATSKVVRVEDILQGSPDVAASPLQLLTNGDLEAVKSPADLSKTASGDWDGTVGVEQTSEATEGDGDESEAARQEDKEYPLPENWPKIKQLKRPMSCALSISRLPCVRKAVSHLELIQNIIDEWFHHIVEEMKSRSTTAESTQSLLAEVPASQKKQLRFRDPSTRSTSRVSQSSVTQPSSRESPASMLSVTGFGAAAEATPEEKAKVDEGLEIPYLGAEDVIDEAITLLARLELDRQETQRNYLKEVDVVASLKKKSNDYRLRLLRELPLLVQKEHEASIMDLNELHWHVNYVTRILAKAQNRKDIAEVLNTRLKEDITFVKQHTPLMQEKLVLELAAMDRIKKAQVETNQELMTTNQRQVKTEQKSTEALSKAETERGHIQRELDIIRDNLTYISEELSTAKMTYNSYVHQVNDMTSQLTDNAQELKVLEVKNANAKAAEEMQATKVRALQSKIAEADFEFQRLAIENHKVEEELKVLRNKNYATLAALEKQAKALESRLLAVTRKNQDLIIIIEDTLEKIQKCEEQKKADEKNLRRIARELERVTTMMQTTVEEHMRVSQINRHIRSQLQAEQEKAFRTEESLKNTAESLRRQVKEETHVCTVLQARIKTDTAEIERTRAESARKKDKADKVASDIGTAVNGVLEKVEKLRAQKALKNEQIANLKSRIKQLEEKHTQTLEEFKQRLADITPHFNKLKEEMSKIDKQHDYMAWKTDLMTKKIEEMNSAQIMMDKVYAKTTAAIKSLMAELEELQIQLKTACKIGEDLHQQYNFVVNQIKDGESRQTHFIAERNQVLKNQEDDKVQSLNKNKDLASRYRQLQNDFLIMKEKLLRGFDEHLKLESTISDVKQLKSLQSKMHGALAEYFKLSGLYNEEKLVRLEQVSCENGMHVGKLQVDMEEALALITNFLQNEMGGTRTREMAWEAMRTMEEHDNGGAGGGGVGLCQSDSVATAS